MIIYEHRQFGWLTIFVVVGVIIFLRFIVPAVVNAPVPFGINGLLLAIAVIGALFSSLTVRVTEKSMAWWFGLPAIGRRVDLQHIASVRAIRTNVFEGWGIHLTWHGWVWNVAGFNAVQITLTSGTRFAVGTPEPDKLIAAIERASGPKT